MAMVPVMPARVMPMRRRDYDTGTETNGYQSNHHHSFQFAHKFHFSVRAVKIFEVYCRILIFKIINFFLKL
jgi:hypothetical protein